ncbi:hypothetical protein [Comamonas sp. F1-6]|uniref:hypothetical protein n=1 Tax=Comamonas sp. F1-6 TaxID=673550 RepID=UPI0031E180C5
MAPFSLNLVTGQDRQHLLGYGRAAFEAGKAGQCLHQIKEPAAAEQAAWHAGLDEGRTQAAPAAVAVPDEREAFEKFIQSPIPRDFYSRVYENWDVNNKWIGWQAHAALAATPAAVPTYIEVRECSDCGHIGINDADGSKAACSKCDWQGDSPVEDKCPDCNTVGTMTAACSKCGARASLLAETTLNAEPIALTAAAPMVLPEPDAEIAVLMNRSACQKYPNDINLRIAHNEGWNAARALLATATGLPAQAVEMPDFDLRTSKGGREFVAWYFANVLQRYDYENYITNKLAADFACDLAKALSSTLAAPQAQADARDAEQEVLMEHSGCGSNTQVDMLTVRLNPGDKVVMHKGRITQGFERANRAAIAAAKGEQQ